MKKYSSKEIKEFTSKPLFDKKIILHKDSSWPKISIITPSYNQAQFIEQTILSVLNQNYPNLEYIIIDGGSTDGSVEIIKKYEKYLTYWVSEKDNGQSQALNKGIERATGEFISWINSDDVFFNSTLRKFVNVFKKNRSCKLFFGNTIWIDKNDNIIRRRKGENYNKFFVKRNMFYAYGPSAFFHRDLIEKYGIIREDFHFMMDTELWLRFVSHGIEFNRLHFFCWGFRLHENAKMSGHNFKTSDYYKETHPSRIQKKKEREELLKLYNYPPKASLSVKFLYVLYKILTPRVFFAFIYNNPLKNKTIHISKNKLI